MRVAALAPWRRPWTRLAQRAAFAAFLGAALAPPTGAEERVVPELQLRAAYLYNFAKFVEWPTSAFADSGCPLVIGVLQDDPFGPVLTTAVQERTLHHRRMEVRPIGPHDSPSGCHILYLSGCDDRCTTRLLGALENSSTLVIGEAESFLALGGMVSFRIEERKLRFAINLISAERARLRLSSKLLDLACELVTTPEARKR